MAEGPTVKFTGKAAAKLHEACALAGDDVDTALMSALALYVITSDGSEWGVQRNADTGVTHAWVQRQVAN